MSAASSTARLPIASLREQTQTERLFASPPRKRYCVIRCVPKEIERIGLQRSRSCRDAGDDLGEEKTGIDDEGDPERPAPAATVRRRIGGAVIIMTASHRLPRQLKVTTYTKSL